MCGRTVRGCTLLADVALTDAGITLIEIYTREDPYPDMDKITVATALIDRTLTPPVREQAQELRLT